MITMTMKLGMALHIYNPITGYVEPGDPQDSLDPPPNLSGATTGQENVIK